RSEDRHDLARRHVEVDAVEGDVLAVELSQTDDLQDGLRFDVAHGGHAVTSIRWTVRRAFAVRVMPRLKRCSTRRCTIVSSVTTTRYQMTATSSIGTTSYVRL